MRSATTIASDGSIKSRVSIHALTRSATSSQCGVVSCPRVSIHALTRSATMNYMFCIPYEGFQSTHSRGVRRPQESTIRARSSFNPRTHEECDALRSGFAGWIWSFNPRTHEECDMRCFMTFRSMWRFQSTHSRGVRHHNPLAWRQEIRVSIHALTRSATRRSNLTGFRSKFQSTHSRGVRLCYV